MTQDFNYKLMKYLTGKINKQEPFEEEYIREINEIDTTSFTNLLPQEYNLVFFQGLIKSNTDDNLILYGYYNYSNESGELNYSGIIIILNKDYEATNAYYTWESGTKLNPILSMKQNEEGLFYLIDTEGFSNDNNDRKRIIFTNNFLTANKIVLRKSYYFPTNYNNFIPRQLYKDPNSGNYCFVGYYVKDNFGNYGITIITLKVEVGKENEWEKFSTNENSSLILGDSFAEYNSENNLLCKIIISSNDGNDKNIYIYENNYDGLNFVKKSIYEVEEDYFPCIDNLTYNNQAKFLNKNEVYFVCNNQAFNNSNQIEKKYIQLYYADLLNNKITQIYSKYLGEYDICNLEFIMINSNQNKIYIEYNNNISNEIVTPSRITFLSDYYYQRYENKWSPILIKKNKLTVNDRLINVNNDFNKLNIFLLQSVIIKTDNFNFYNIVEVYNPTNYNNISYENTNSLVPNSGVLYNGNNNIIFARNLYNKTINNRITQSTIEVPNTYLNNTIINSQELDSKTNNVMVNNINTITKNIYETLFINFINTLQITNENDENNIILNPIGATRLNISISDLIDYDNAKATKIRINYDDGTNLIRDVSNNIEDVRQVNLLTFTNYDFVVYNPANKNIKTIDIISNDETTIYQTISNLNFESNKYYNIMQPVQILGNV